MLLNSAPNYSPQNVNKVNISCLVSFQHSRKSDVYVKETGVLSYVILCGRIRQMFLWKALWREGKRKKRREGSFSHMSSIVIFM